MYFSLPLTIESLCTKQIFFVLKTKSDTLISRSIPYKLLLSAIWEHFILENWIKSCRFLSSF